MSAELNHEKWVSLSEIADYIGVSKDTIRNWIKHSNMPAQKIGRLWKFKISDVDEWIAARNDNSARE